MEPTLVELERLDAAGRLRGCPALTAKLHAMRLEADAERELASLRTSEAQPAAEQREHPLPSEPLGDCVGLLCLNHSGHAFPLWTQDGRAMRLYPASTLCFAPREFVEFVQETWARSGALSAAFGRGVVASGLRFVVFDPEDLEDEINLIEFLRARLDGASSTEIGVAWRTIVEETTNAERLTNWYAAAWRVGDQEQLKRLRSRLVRLAIPVPLLSEALLGKGHPHPRRGSNEPTGPEAA